MKNRVEYYYLVDDDYKRITISGKQQTKHLCENMFWLVLVFILVPHIFLNLEIINYYFNFFFAFLCVALISVVQWRFYVSLHKFVKKNDKQKIYYSTEHFGQNFTKFCPQILKLIFYKSIVLVVVLLMSSLGSLMVYLSSNAENQAYGNVMIVSLIALAFVYAGFEFSQSNAERQFGMQNYSLVNNIKQNILSNGDKLLVSNGDMLHSILLEKEYIGYIIPIESRLKQLLDILRLQRSAYFWVVTGVFITGTVSFFGRHSLDRFSLQVFCIGASAVLILFVLLVKYIVLWLIHNVLKQQVKDIHKDSKNYAKRLELEKYLVKNKFSIIHNILSSISCLIFMTAGFVLGIVLYFDLDRYAFLMIVLTLLGWFLHACLVHPFISILSNKLKLRTILFARQIWKEDI
ncbi:MAG: hypothetical protein LBU60_06540 [Clostridiales bacterium]|jgi:hypothetical protein|nr:hypothetical protein [Clostridiales bacterium]